MANSQDKQYGEKETEKRRDDALKRALSMSHKPHEPLKKKPKSGARR